MTNQEIEVIHGPYRSATPRMEKHAKADRMPKRLRQHLAGSRAVKEIKRPREKKRKDGKLIARAQKASAQYAAMKAIIPKL